MPARRFWTMENNILRIIAEQDMRKIQVQGAGNSEESCAKVMDRLTAEIGETAQIKHSKFVKPEPDAKAKFKSLTG